MPEEQINYAHTYTISLSSIIFLSLINKVINKYNFIKYFDLTNKNEIVEIWLIFVLITLERIYTCIRIYYLLVEMNVS